MTLSRDEVLQLEEMNFNAWPALTTVHYDGWLLRCAGGASRRPNSVNCISPSTIALETKIAAAEAMYARWKRRTIFRLTPLADAGLGELIARRGYVVEEPTDVQVADLAECSAAPDVEIATACSDAWIRAALAIREIGGEHARVFNAQHHAIAVESIWALTRDEGAPAAVGVAAIERGWAGLHGIYVSKHVRRRGLARRLSEALLSVSAGRGARHAWLQVAHANTAALPLYRQLGFRTAYTYHHLVPPA